jgi:acetolactate synthase regulatory subunit
VRFTVVMILRRSERAFERAVALAGRRGYELVGASATLSEEGLTLLVRLTLESDRKPETLVHQLARLYEVQSIRLEPGGTLQ